MVLHVATPPPPESVRESGIDNYFGPLESSAMRRACSIIASA
jgi:hypothetical protein